MLITVFVFRRRIEQRRWWWRSISGTSQYVGTGFLPESRPPKARLSSSACICEKQRADRLNDPRLVVYSAAAGTSAKKETINRLGDKVGPGLKFGVD